MLQEMDAAAIEQRIAEVVGRLRTIPAERDAMVAQQTRSANLAARREEEEPALRRKGRALSDPAGELA